MSYESCKTFIGAFELLYSARNVSMYPFPNPMRLDPQTPALNASSGMVLFPTEYMFEQNVYGVASVALPDLSTVTTLDNRIFVIGTQNCLACSPPGGNAYCYPTSCSDNDASQQFIYDPATYQIKELSSENCLINWPNTADIEMTACSDGALFHQVSFY